MPSYRLFKIDPASGHRDPGEWLDAPDDDAALLQAKQVAKSAKCELWLSDRLIGVIVRTN